VEAHNYSLEEYIQDHGPIASPTLEKLYEAKRKSITRTPAPSIEELTTDFAGYRVPVNWDVPVEDCLPMPKNYRFPTHGKLAEDVREATISFLCKRSTYIWGMPGSGKDALPHAYSAITRTPAEMFVVQPGTDIMEWFFVRSFDSEGTGYDEGRLLKLIRKGYLTKSGRQIPCIILISDIDRAEPSQMEAMRLLLDSIQGRVKGPQGTTYQVFPGTQFIMTANTSGAGDERGRCISANPIDASMLDRFERVFEFHWMLWEDEGPICQAKFPLLVQRCPEVFRAAGVATMAMRSAIAQDDLYTEFSHRAVCAWLGHAEDIIRVTGRVPKDLLGRAAKCWLDKMPDKATRMKAARIVDPSSGTLKSGDTSHIRQSGYHS
jgi:hypothetical protein